MRTGGKQYPTLVTYKSGHGLIYPSTAIHPGVHPDQINKDRSFGTLEVRGEVECVAIVEGGYSKSTGQQFWSGWDRPVGLLAQTGV